MPAPATVNLTTLVRQMDDLAWSEINQTVACLQKVPGAERPLQALLKWQATTTGDYIYRAEAQIVILLGSSDMPPEQVVALADALVHIGRALAFLQIAFRSC